MSKLQIMMKDILGSPNQQKLTSLGESMRHLTWLRDGGSCWPEEQRHQPLTGGDRQEQQEDEDGDQPLEGGEHLHRRPTYSTNFTTKIQKICVSDTSIIYSSCSSQHYNLCFRSGSTKSRNRTEARLEDWADSVSEFFFKSLKHFVVFSSFSWICVTCGENFLKFIYYKFSG